MGNSTQRKTSSRNSGGSFLTDDLPHRQPRAPEHIKGQYAEEVTSHSYKELQNLAMWAKHKGPMFYLIGGWAAWRYHGGLGSRDIDVIFPDRVILDNFLQLYYKANGYENHGGILSKQYRKPVEIGDQTFLIQIDAAGLDQGPPFKEDKDRNIPFTELEKHSLPWELETATVRIPRPELLFLQKVKAWRDRRWDLDHTAVDAVDVQYLQGKIWKDAYDIRNLEPRIEDWNVVWGITEKNACTNLIAQAIETLGIEPSEPPP